MDRAGQVFSLISHNDAIRQHKFCRIGMSRISQVVLMNLICNMCSENIRKITTASHMGQRDKY